MKRNFDLKALLAIFAMAFLFVLCSIKEANNNVSFNMANEPTMERVDVTTDQLFKEVQEIKLPNVINLHYTGIEPEPILQADDLTLLKKIKDQPLGKVDGEQINISLYSDNDNNIHGVFKHKGKKYILNFLGYTTDLESVKVHELQLIYYSNGRNIVLVSGIGSFILGYQYILFDGSSNSWSSFHNWGTPQAIDIYHDGVMEVFLQFHGLHLNTPDLNILSFQDGRFMVTEINAEVYKNGKLDTMKSKIASTYIKEQDNKILIEINNLMGKEGPILYHLESDELNSPLLRLVKEIQNIQLIK